VEVCLLFPHRPPRDREGFLQIITQYYIDEFRAAPLKLSLAALRKLRGQQ
jgi:hypothetical protein